MALDDPERSNQKKNMRHNKTQIISRWTEIKLNFFFCSTNKKHTHTMKFEQFLIPIAILVAAMLVARSTQNVALASPRNPY